MKKEVSPAIIIGALIAVVICLGVGIYLFVRPEPVQTRKGVPWEGRASAGGAGAPSNPRNNQGGPPPGP